ncbi:MAG: hypothetical protein AAF266_16625, partial [Planctomycetota bacterium]
MRQRLRLVLPILGSLVTVVTGVCADELLLSDFNNSGFTYTYGGFTDQNSATSTRLFDSDGWGAG